MKRALLVILVITTTSSALFAQYQRCASTEYNEMIKKQHPEMELNLAAFEDQMEEDVLSGNLNRSGATVTIPVVFHVLYTSSVQNISTSRIMAQLDVLNQDYSGSNPDIGNVPSVFQSAVGNADIQFCLATQDPQGNSTDGILRIQTSTSSFSMQSNNIKFSSAGGSNAWPRDSYLNIWVGNLTGSILGYAQFPGGPATTDGVVLLYSAVGGPSAPGTAFPYHLGRTATHEIGHWLNLRHIWGDSFCGNDFCADTPPQDGSNFSCPSFPHTSSCTGNPPNGDMFMNFMDYVNDNCMIMFTNDQGIRMNAILNSSLRAPIKASQGCIPVGLNEASALGLDIYPNPTSGDLIIENSMNVSGVTTIKMFSAVGQLVFERSYEVFSGMNRIETSALNDGIYFLEVRNEKQHAYEKIMISK